MYALSDKEETSAHSWIIERLIEAVGIEPEVFVSDMDLAIEQVISLRCQIRHTLCIQHIFTNLPKNLRSKLHDTFLDFMKAFWHCYWSKLQAVFENRWNVMLEHYPAAVSYLQQEIHPRKQKWAWAWTGLEFTAGTRTNGRVESENGVDNSELKALRLRWYHKAKSGVDVLFGNVLYQMRGIVCHYVHKTIHDEMEESLYTPSLVLPTDITRLVVTLRKQESLKPIY
ncbi:hypothetical protein PsorP6_017174 [Peronosclerospora sorghi]|uniref:Uncharacterized protein n=1 Tax=Peronosclerospora sorghi TaxID=230839 RepID=A0ACC0WDQ9_9STRA|nr:hypothetical protein PsorP6_017174 [Peronosclerospora sorghi]